MAKTRAIVKRRKAIRNIRKITRTMELIATSRFQRALNRVVEAEAYTRKIAEVAADLSASVTDIAHPLLQKREEVKNSMLLVITSNRGLCGGYNAVLLREANARIKQMKAEGVTLHLEASGKRAIAYFRYQGVQLEAKYTHFEDKPSFHEVEELANRYLASYIAGRIDRVEVCYMKFLNAARQTPVVETLLPLATVAPETRQRGAAPVAERKQVEYEFLPSAARHPGRTVAGVVQGPAVQVLPGCGGQRADRPARGHEGRHRKRQRHDHAPDPPVQPGPPGADHQRDRRGHRRGRGTGVNKPTGCAWLLFIGASMATVTNGSTTGMHVGHIVQVIGSTFDAEFEEGHLPEIYNALHDRHRLQGRADPPDRRGAAAPGRQPGPLRGPGFDRRPGARHEGHGHRQAR